METNSILNEMVKCLFHVIARAVMPPDKVMEVIGGGKRQVMAFNQCDGHNSQKEIAKKTGINQGNLSREFKKWLEAGVAFSIGDGKEARLLHIYPIPRQSTKQPGRSRKSTRKARSNVS